MEAYDTLGIEYHILTEKGTRPVQAQENALLSPRDSLVALMRNILRVRRASAGYDVVHALDVWPYGLYAFAAVVGRKSALFLCGIGTYSVAPLYQPVKRLMLTRVFARTKKIFCISGYTMREMIRAMPALSEKAVVVHLGATTLPTPSREDVERVRMRYGIDGSPIVLSVGAIKERKGQFDTLQAIALLKKQYPSIMYIAVGSARDHHYVERMRGYSRERALENNLRIIDTVETDRDLAALYSLCDVFALNSKNDSAERHFEGFGLVFLEAYQFGKSVVGSRDCGIEDAIEDGVTGYLCDQGDISDISAKISEILVRGPKTFDKDIQTFRKQFTWAKAAQTYIHYYQTK